MRAWGLNVSMTQLSSLKVQILEIWHWRPCIWLRGLACTMDGAEVHPSHNLQF